MNTPALVFANRWIDQLVFGLPSSLCPSHSLAPTRLLIAFSGVGTVLLSLGMESELMGTASIHTLWPTSSCMYCSVIYKSDQVEGIKDVSNPHLLCPRLFPFVYPPVGLLYVKTASLRMQCATSSPALFSEMLFLKDRIRGLRMELEMKVPISDKELMEQTDL